MRDVLLNEVQDKDGGNIVDVLPLLASTALDIIGKAGKNILDHPKIESLLCIGFGYEFNSIEEGEANELAAAVVRLFAPKKAVRIFTLTTCAH